MFSKIQNIFKAFFHHTDPVEDDLAIHRQIYRELTAEVKESMITTRTQDHTRRSPSAWNENDKSSKISFSNERENSVADTASPSRSIKRKRTDLRVEPIDNEKRTLTNVEPAVSSIKYGKKFSHVEIQSTPTVDPSPLVNVQATQTEETQIVALASCSITDDTDLFSKVGQAPATDVEQDHSLGKMGAKQSTGKEEGRSAAHNAMATATISKYIEGDSATSQRPRHERFDSEEIKESQSSQPLLAISDPTLPKDIKEITEDIESGTSEDEAPETITASTGLIESRTAKKEAMKAVQRQAEAKKERLRERDVRFKQQANRTKRPNKRKTSHVLEASELGSSSANEFKSRKAKFEATRRTPELTSKDPLPVLLPDEILAVEPRARSPTPPVNPTTVSVTNFNKRRLLDADPKPIKDVKRGSIKVRVLESNKSILAPRNSKTSMMLKESWLAGRRGRKGGVEIERRKIGGGFVRK